MKFCDMYEHVASAYPGVRWRKRVAQMKPKRVIAIFLSMQEREALARSSRNIHPTQKTPASGRTDESMPERELQLTIWDIPGCHNL